MVDILIFFRKSFNNEAYRSLFGAPHLHHLNLYMTAFYYAV